MRASIERSVRHLYPLIPGKFVRASNWGRRWYFIQILFPVVPGVPFCWTESARFTSFTCLTSNEPMKAALDRSSGCNRQCDIILGVHCMFHRVKRVAGQCQYFRRNYAVIVHAKFVESKRISHCCRLKHHFKFRVQNITMGRSEALCFM